MNLWFRFLWVMVTGLKRSRRSILEPSRLRFRTWPLDLDMNFHMNNGRFLTLMDLGRVDLMLGVGLFKTIFQRGWMPVVGSVHVTYRRSLGLFDAVDLTTQVVAWDEKWFYIEQEFRSKGRLAARALVKTGLKERHGMIAPERILAMVGSDARSAGIPEFWREIIRADQHLHVDGR